jgi:hypothetical protein
VPGVKIEANPGIFTIVELQQMCAVLPPAPDFLVIILFQGVILEKFICTADEVFAPRTVNDPSARDGTYTKVDQKRKDMRLD